MTDLRHSPNAAARHVVVATCAHRGDDARIVHRQVGALLAAGHRVTLIAPEPFVPQPGAVRMTRITVPRATGRHRLRAWRAVHRAVTGACRHSRVDVVLIHDPELVPVVTLRRPVSAGRTVPVIWDVHEDYVASVADRRWIPVIARRPIAAVVRRIEHLASRRCRLIAAEYSYRRHLGDVAVVPNSTPVPERPAPFDAVPPLRVVYVGRISRRRGCDEMLAVARRLHDRPGEPAVEMILIGPVDDDRRAAVEQAVAEGVVTWTGPLPNPDALALVDGALAGLCLLYDTPNYHHSQPTKIAEYLAHGTPAIATPLPLAAELVADSSGGILVGHGAAVGDRLIAETVAAIERLRDDAALRIEMGEAGHGFVHEHHNWNLDGPMFVALIEAWVAAAINAERAGTSRRRNRR